MKRNELSSSDFKPIVKKLYTVEISKVEHGKEVYNYLENSYYITNENKPFVITGTAGEEWTVDANKISKTYNIIGLYGKRLSLTPEDLEKCDNFDKLKFETIIGDKAEINWAYRLDLSETMEVETSWGEVLTANRDGIPHGDGDLIVCSSDENGNPNLSEMWVVNGVIAEKTYKYVV